jgi:hydroxymethylpyrimidine pyrophosphatase-like HAD family hydrolase
VAIGGLALDLDGTLLRPDDSISERDRRAVVEAVEAGWSVVLATARWYQLAERTARSLGLVDPVIACSGAEVRRLRDGVDLLDERLPAAFAADLYAVCDGHDGLVMVYEDQDVAMRSVTATPRLPEMRRIETLACAEPTPRAVLVFGADHSRLVLDALAPRWADEVRFLVSMTGRGAGVLTITGKGADKGRALAVACADLGLDLADVVAFGDSETDIEMFRVAGASVAMGQAAPDVRAAATWSTTSNVDDGVGRAIEQLLLTGTVDAGSVPADDRG